MLAAFYCATYTVELHCYTFRAIYNISFILMLLHCSLSKLHCAFVFLCPCHAYTVSSMPDRGSGAQGLRGSGAQGLRGSGAQGFGGSWYVLRGCKTRTVFRCVKPLWLNHVRKSLNICAFSWGPWSNCQQYRGLGRVVRGAVWAEWAACSWLF